MIERTDGLTVCSEHRLSVSHCSEPGEGGCEPTLQHSITPTRYQDVSVPRPGGLPSQCHSRHPGGCGGGQNLSHQQILLRHF